jgi:hypothetical protein
VDHSFLGRSNVTNEVIKLGGDRKEVLDKLRERINQARRDGYSVVETYDGFIADAGHEFDLEQQKHNRNPEVSEGMAFFIGRYKAAIELLDKKYPRKGDA